MYKLLNIKIGEGNGTKRQSNFELLRIVSMLLVLLAHYVPTRENPTVESLYQNTLATLCTIELRSLSIVCVNCFVLISGYWGIRLNIKSFANYLYQIIFWSAASVLTASVLGFSSSFGVFLKGIVWGWFPWAYIVLMILSPVINAFVEKCSVRELGRYLIVFYLFSTIGGYLLGCRDFYTGMSGLSLVGLYLIGAYLRRCDFKPFSYSAKVNFAVYLVLGVVLLGVNVLLLMVGIKSSPYGYLNPVVIVMSVYLFLAFANLNIGSVAIINKVATSAFAVYLFHCHPAIGGWISHRWEGINEVYGAYASILVAIASFLAIFAFCFVVDRLRIYTFKIISNSVFNNGKG